ncbi:ATP-binding protein [Streptococcus suis]
MGVKYSASESAMLIQAMGNNIQLANEVTDRLSSGCDHLIASLDSGELQGAAYTAGRGLFSDIIIPSIKKLQAAIDDIQTELDSYKVADGTVSGYGTLDLEELKRLEELRNRQLDIVIQQIEENESFLNQVGALLSGNYGKLWSDTGYLYQAKENLEVGLQDIQEKIEKLGWFVSQVSSYFTDSLEVLRLAIQGATQLSQVLVDSDGSYYTEGLDMNWVVGMKNQPLKSHALTPGTPVTKAEKDKKLIIDDFKNSYGLDEETALALYNLQQGILERAEREGWSNEQVIYEYNRLVASPVYGERATWRGLSGVIGEKDLNESLKKYGLSDKEINKLKREIESQHSSTQFNKDLAHEAIQLSSFTEQSWVDRDLSTNEGWIELMSHILSSSGNSMRVGDISISTEKYESSFRGDVNSGRYDDTDFNSDLDAINIYGKVTSTKVKHVEIFPTQARYNSDIMANQVNRVEVFYKTLGQGNYKKGQAMVDYLLENETIGGNYIKKTRTNSEKKSKNDFYNYLERGVKVNVGT